MVKHIVMFKLAEKNQASMDKALAALKSLDGAVETLRSIEVGVDFKESERSYDIVLTTQFDDKAGLETYAAHPNHQPVLQTMRELCASSVVVDYEL
ncbi:MAG: Dabb family protein [SAR324 cluster bacterium]|nr:Dabb family protein [SAR324 cluster bacterium]